MSEAEDEELGTVPPTEAELAELTRRREERLVTCPYCKGTHDEAVFAEQGCPDREDGA